MAVRQRSPRHALNEWRRRRAWALHQEGWTGAVIAQALDVTPGAVSQWLKKAREGGADALAVRIPPGSAPRLRAGRGAHLPACLASGPEPFGFLAVAWTPNAVPPG